jgi:hypothetical protein
MLGRDIAPVMGEVSISETLGNFYETTRRNIAKTAILNLLSLKNESRLGFVDFS